MFLYFFAFVYVISFACLVACFVKVSSYKFADISYKKRTGLISIISFIPACVTAFFLSTIFNFLSQNYHNPGLKRGFNYFADYHYAVFLFIEDHYVNVFKIAMVILYVFSLMVFFGISEYFIKSEKYFDTFIQQVFG